MFPMVLNLPAATYSISVVPEPSTAGLLLGQQHSPLRWFAAECIVKSILYSF